MYASYFGLKEAPFSIAPDPRYLYMGERHREAFAHLMYGVGEGGGFAQLTGEVGTGKTTLCRCLLAQLPEGVDVAFVLNPKVTEIELLASICDELRIEYIPERASQKLLVDALYRYLLDARGRGRHTVLIIDEAQSLSCEVLEQIRLLTNLETTTEKLLQVILIGQPELIGLLAQEELRQLAQRITARYHLLPFSKAEARQYIAHRMEVAGGGARVFTSSALRRIYRFSKGVPRLINVVCDRALLGAYVGSRPRVDASIVRQAIQEIAGHRLSPGASHLYRWGVVVALLVAIGAGAWTGWLAAQRGSSLEGGPVALSPADPLPRIDPPVPAVNALSQPSEPKPVSREPDRVTADAVRAETGTGEARKLADILGDAAIRSDENTAFAALFSLWGLDSYVVGRGTPCEQARRRGLQCLVRSGTWNNLRLLHLPAILELADGSGSSRYAVLKGLSEQAGTLVFGDQTLRFSLGEIEPYWYGRYTVLWKSPLSGNVMLGPGLRGRDVLWVRERLAAIPGEPVPSASIDHQDVYDEALTQRVTAFQRRHSLAADGIVGPETLAHLSTAVNNPEAPVLGQVEPLAGKR